MFIAVTKSVTIATNPSNKLPLAVTILIAVEEVNSGPLASTNLGEVIWTSNRFKDLYIKDRSEPKDGKIFLRLISKHSKLHTNFLIGGGLAGHLQSPL